jgi:hypothetical protein
MSAACFRKGKNEHTHVRCHDEISSRQKWLARNSVWLVEAIVVFLEN